MTPTETFDRLADNAAQMNADTPTYAGLQARRALIGPRLPSLYSFDDCIDVSDNWIDAVDPENEHGAIVTAFFNGGSLCKVVAEIDETHAVYSQDQALCIFGATAIDRMEAMI